MGRQPLAAMQAAGGDIALERLDDALVDRPDSLECRALIHTIPLIVLECMASRMDIQADNRWRK
jgi:hypothetical protein